MSLPATVRVKLSSEAAEGISITRVVVQDLPLRDLVENMLGITGKNEARVRELLLRGTLVSGASRFRWTGWEAELDALRELLATFPGDDPMRPFASARCVRAVLRGGRQAIQIPLEAGARKPLLLKQWQRKASFWDVLMDLAAASEAQYLHYSYKDRADCYRLDMPLAAAEKLRAASEAVKYSSLREQIRSAGFVWAELYVAR
ncbi:MAG TPA: hypothetical protein VMQ86_21630 [Bryobacteraceae bacterium]|nr:hypothetical protein [Bryobacteraceae bacterium]